MAVDSEDIPLPTDTIADTVTPQPSVSNVDSLAPEPPVFMGQSPSIPADIDLEKEADADIVILDSDEDDDDDDDVRSRQLLLPNFPNSIFRP